MGYFRVLLFAFVLKKDQFDIDFYQTVIPTNQ